MAWQAATEAEREADAARRDKSIRLKAYHLKQAREPPSRARAGWPRGRLGWV
jgi:hypothetical protein